MTNLKPPSADILEIFEPKSGVLPLVFDSPHSGRHYPEDFNHDCPIEALKRAEDNDVEQFFLKAPDYGASFLHALFPRTYIDVNRSKDDIDPDLLDAEWCAHSHGPINPSSRSNSGIGLIRRILKPGIPVYSRTLAPEEIKHRITHYYQPYHSALEKLLNRAHYNFGQVWHMNCHSMPSASVSRIASHSPIALFSHQPDFVLGDRDGTSCAPEFTRLIRDFLKQKGYRVAINHPYKGVELVRRYSSPATGRHSIQLEINKALYWDEHSNKRKKGYDALKQDLESLITFLADYTQSQLIDRAAD